MVLTDATGKVVWVNAGFTRLTGYTLDETIGKKPGLLLQGTETDPATVRYMHEQLSKGEGFKAQIINYSKTGRKYWLATEVQPIRNEAGEILNFMAIQSDITERKNSETLLLETSTLQRAMLEGAGSPPASSHLPAPFCWPEKLAACPPPDREWQNLPS